MFFDLKGSLTNRKVKFEQKWWTQGKYGHKKVMKDVNFLEINKHFNNNLIKFSKNEIKKFEKIIKNDSVFLKNLGLMDYSLLLVVETIFGDSTLEKQDKSSRGQIVAKNKISKNLKEKPVEFD